MFIINSYQFAVTSNQYPTGAAYAFGLRELPGFGYTGALVRVRRSSDNTESDFFQGSSPGDLNTTRGGGGTSLASWVGSNDGYVVTWYDQSGNGRNVTQTTTTEQPRIVSSGTIETQNTLPTIRFGYSSGRHRLRRTGTTLARPITIFAWAKLDSATVVNTILDGAQSTQHIFYATGTTESPNNRFIMSAGTAFNVAAQNSNFNAHYALFNGSSSAHSLNNGSDTTGTAGNNDLVGITIGHIRSDLVNLVPNYNLKGVVSELVIYSADQSKTAPLATGNDYFEQW